MIDRIASPIPDIPDLNSVGAGGRAPGVDFATALTNAISKVESANSEATAAADRFLSGGGGDIHSAALASQRSALQLEYFLQVRNKVLQAYQEIMRMQL